MNAVTWISFQDELAKIAASDELKGAVKGAARSGLTTAGAAALWNIFGGRKLPISVGGSAALSSVLGAYMGAKSVRQGKQLRKFLQEHDIQITPKAKMAALKVKGAPKVPGYAQIVGSVSLQGAPVTKTRKPGTVPKGDVIS